MATAPKNTPSSDSNMNRRERPRAERQRPSKPEINGRIRTRSKKLEVNPVSLKPAQEKPTVRRVGPEERNERPRGTPKEGRKYKPLIHAKNGMRLDDLEHEVGYGRTPKKSKFKSGKSGNPKGRPKGSKGLKTILNDALGKKIVSRTNGKEKRITTREGIIMRLMKKALDGDHNAIKLIMAKDEGFELQSLIEVNGQNAADNSTEFDDEILKEFERQILERANQRDPVTDETLNEEDDDDHS